MLRMLLVLVVLLGVGKASFAIAGSPQHAQNVKQDAELFPVRVSGKSGYIDKTGKIVIQPQFLSAAKFSEALAAVYIGRVRSGQWGYIDKTGEIVFKLPFNYSRVQKFSEGLAVVLIYDHDALTNYAGYIDKTGKYIAEFHRFTWAYDFSDGLARVDAGDKFGYINKKGKYVWQPNK